MCIYVYTYICLKKEKIRKDTKEKTFEKRNTKKKETYIKEYKLTKKPKKECPQIIQHIIS